MYLNSFFIGIVLLFFGSWFNRPSEGSRRAGAHIKNTVTAKAETTPLLQKKNDDSADDPAIWVHPEDVTKSIIIGTDKKGGLATYNLDGEQLYYLPAGRLNNCDVRSGFNLNGNTITVVAASNRTNQSVSLFQLNEDGKMDSIHSKPLKTAMTDEVYGLCMYLNSDNGKYYVFMNSKAGEIEQWELLTDQNGIDAKLVRTLKLENQPEGMVVDEENGWLYVGEEEVGIWKFKAAPDGDNKPVFIEESSEKNPNIKYDIEGLALYKKENGQGYLVASSQGNYSYAVFSLNEGNPYVGSFRILGGEFDSVEETDGIEITTTALGPQYPKGLLVVQDGYNYTDGKKRAQNFKYISMEDVLKFFE